MRLSKLEVLILQNQIKIMEMLKTMQNEQDPTENIQKSHAVIEENNSDRGCLL